MKTVPNMVRCPSVRPRQKVLDGVKCFEYALDCKNAHGLVVGALERSQPSLTHIGVLGRLQLLSEEEDMPPSAHQRRSVLNQLDFWLVGSGIITADADTSPCLRTGLMTTLLRKTTSCLKFKGVLCFRHVILVAMHKQNILVGRFEQFTQARGCAFSKPVER